MARIIKCVNCFSNETIKKGRRRGMERRLCLSCNRWFSVNRVKRKVVSSRILASLHLNGISFRKLSSDFDIPTTTIYRKVNEFLESLPHNADITRKYCSKFCGILVVDGKYLPVRGYNRNLSLIWGVDYLTHDIPHFKLAPNEGYQASLNYFQSLRLMNYPLQCLVSDDNICFKMAATKMYPRVVIQTCTNHYKENVRRSLNTRTDDTYRNFMKGLEYIFSHKRNIPEFDTLASKLFQKYKNNQLITNVMYDLERKKQELLAYQKVPQTPYTTNIIESYNSHLEARLKPLKSFDSFKSANLWLNGYILKRRTTKFKACGGKFKILNGKSALSLTLQDNQTPPIIF